MELLHFYVLTASFQQALPRDTTGLIVGSVAGGSLNLVNRIVCLPTLLLLELFRLPHRANLFS